MLKAMVVLADVPAVLWHGLRDSFLMAWEVWWALVLGFAISAVVQAWVPRARIERAAKRIGSSLEAAPIVYVADPELFGIATEVDLAELCITSAATLVEGEGPPSAFRLDDVAGVAVEPRRAEGFKCARSWKISPAVGSDPQYPDVTPRDAQALREWDAMRKAAE